MSLLPIFAAQSGQITKMNLPESLLTSLLGMAVVFLALVAIMALVKLQSAATARFMRAPAAVSAPAVRPAVSGTPAPGSLGELKLHTVSDKTAALLMAIVADELQAPLNTLRFISIKEVP